MFWVLNRPKDPDNSIYGTISGIADKPVWKTLPCLACGRSRVLEQMRNLSIELYGLTLMDFVWTDSVEVIVTASFMNLLKKSDLRGFTFTEVDVLAWWRADPITREIVDWSVREPIRQLFQIVVQGKGGSVVPQNRTRIQSACSVCGLTVYEPLEGGILVNTHQWDGSDVFVMEEFGYVLVTERFLKYLEANRIQNYSVIPADKFSMV